MLLDLGTQLRERIVAEPANPVHRFAIGEFYEREGNLFAAARAYSQVLRLSPNYPQADDRLKKLLDIGVNIEDEDRANDPLPPLPGEVVENPADQLIMALSQCPMIGTVQNADKIDLKPGMADQYIKVSTVQPDRIAIKSQTTWNIVFAVGGACGLIYVIGVLIYRLSQDGAVLTEVRVRGLATITVASLAGLGCLLFMGRGLVLDRGRSLRETTFGRVTHRWLFPSDGRVCLYLNREQSGARKHCVAYLADPQGNELTELGSAFSDEPAAAFYLRLAARVADLLEVPLQILGSPHECHPTLQRGLLQVCRQLKPLGEGGPL